jgi:hypothetical protein
LRDVIRREALADLHRLVPRIRRPWPITGITFRGFVGATARMDGTAWPSRAAYE